MCCVGVARCVVLLSAWLIWCALVVCVVCGLVLCVVVVWFMCVSSLCDVVPCGVVLLC